MKERSKVKVMVAHKLVSKISVAIVNISRQPENTNHDPASL